MAQFYCVILLAAAATVSITLALSSEEKLKFLNQKIEEALADLDDDPSDLVSKIIKLLVMQGWIHYFKPQKDDVKYFGEDMPLQDIEKQCKMFLVQEKNSVPNAVLLFLNKWSNDIVYINERIEDANKHIEYLQEEIVKNPNDKTSLEQLKTDDEERRNHYSEELLTYTTLHEIVRQSYVINFNIESKSGNFDITSSDGESNSFIYPQLNTLSELN